MPRLHPDQFDHNFWKQDPGICILKTLSRKFYWAASVENHLYNIEEESSGKLFLCFKPFLFLRKPHLPCMSSCLSSPFPICPFGFLPNNSGGGQRSLVEEVVTSQLDIRSRQVPKPMGILGITGGKNNILKLSEFHKDKNK